ncbi:hypothetical protein ACPF04_05585 [Campylobacter sp. MOP51]|uniref:hypothetical protein n=1 Tax=Campylobacter canis TaxID=3378588 RepID=UPI003C639C58
MEFGILVENLKLSKQAAQSILLNSQTYNGSVIVANANRQYSLKKFLRTRPDINIHLHRIAGFDLEMDVHNTKVVVKENDIFIYIDTSSDHFWYWFRENLLLTHVVYDFSFEPGRIVIQDPMFDIDYLTLTDIVLSIRKFQAEVNSELYQSA